MNCQTYTDSEKIFGKNPTVLRHTFERNSVAGVLLAAGGKPSTMFPPGRLVELFKELFDVECTLIR